MDPCIPKANRLGKKLNFVRRLRSALIAIPELNLPSTESTVRVVLFLADRVQINCFPTSYSKQARRRVTAYT